jgi:hypothetical protein
MKEMYRTNVNPINVKREDTDSFGFTMKRWYLSE